MGYLLLGFPSNYLDWPKPLLGFVGTGHTARWREASQRLRGLDRLKARDFFYTPNLGLNLLLFLHPLDLARVVAAVPGINSQGVRKSGFPIVAGVDKDSTELLVGHGFQ